MTNTPSQASSVQMLEVSPEFAGQRIDNFLRNQLKGVPKTLIYRILRKGEVRVNKGRVKPEYKIQAGDIVRVPPVRLPERDEPAPIRWRLRGTCRNPRGLGLAPEGEACQLPQSREAVNRAAVV